MTLRSVGFGRGFPRVWLLPIAALIVILGVAVIGRLSRSIVADLLAWWPVWLGLTLAAVFLRDRRIGQFRVAGLIPLTALVFVALFLWGHLAGWSIMPSAAQRLVGPEVGGFNRATLSADIDGEIYVRGGSEYLYRVEPAMGGGGIGIPQASEQVVDSTVSIVLEPQPAPGLYTYAGWDLTLADEPRWTLTLNGAIDADLSSLRVDDLSIDGSGVVGLGDVETETRVSVSGSFRIVVPADTPARVVGAASVPSSWVLDGRGAMSPVSGPGWVIAVGPEASVTVSER